MNDISRISLKKVYISKLGYVDKGAYYLGYLPGTFIYEARWEIKERETSWIRLEYFRAESRAVAKEAVIKYMSPYGYKPGNIKFYN